MLVCFLLKGTSGHLNSKGFLRTVQLKNQATTSLKTNSMNVNHVYMHSFRSMIETRRLAACTQAVIILRSTSYIATELKCSASEVVRNSIESMRLSYSAFDCISWNRLIAYYSFTDLKHVKGVKIVISAYERFSLFSLFEIGRAHV